MSELGNIIRRVRGETSQAEFGKEVGLALRTICKIEDGDLVRKSTIMQIADRKRLPQEDRLNLLAAWIRQQLGDDHRHFYIDLKNTPAASDKGESLLTQLQSAVTHVPTRYQEALLKACHQPEILKGIVHMAETYDRLKAITKPKSS